MQVSDTESHLQPKKNFHITVLPTGGLKKTGISLRVT